jgi:hypothetical protein
MLVEPLFTAELAIAEIAFPPASIVSIVCSPTFSCVVVMPFQEILSNYACLIAIADKVVYAFSIRIFVWARIRLEVVGEATGRCKAPFTKGTLDVGSAMDT